MAIGDEEYFFNNGSKTFNAGPAFKGYEQLDFEETIAPVIAAYATRRTRDSTQKFI